MRSSPRSHASLALAALAASCTSVGPHTIPHDRFDYIQALRESWKEEMLLNIVGLRYTELPVFLQVTSLINQYRAEGRLEGTLSTGDDSVSAGVTLSDQPTITYVPLSGEQFTREIMTPVSPNAVVSLLQSGWPVSLIFRTMVRSINGIGSQLGEELDPRFLDVIERLQRIQQVKGIGVRVVKQGEGSAVLLLFPTAASPEVQDDVMALQKALGIPSGAGELRLVYGQAASEPGEIAILTRSAIELLLELGRYVEVPEADVREGRTRATREDLPNVPQSGEHIRIHSGAARPHDAFVSVRFRGVWYWVDDTDLVSKRMLSFAMLTLSLTAGSVAGIGPVVTVSAGS